MVNALRAERKYILWLLFLYTVSQGLILIVTGMWYDDWCIVNISREGLKMWASEMGRPEVFPIFYAIKTLPDFVYKLVIFLSYFIVTMCFFMISKRVFSLSSLDAFRLTVLFLSIPANDIRLERLGLPYTIGLTLFSVAFFLLLYNYENLSIVCRIILLILFFSSYILNSLLFFMGLVWLYIIIKEKNVKKVFGKIDFIIAPFIYFMIDKVFFPAHGVYEGYNSVTIEKMINAVIGTFRAMGDLIGQIITIFLSFVITYPIFYLNNRFTFREEEGEQRNIPKAFIKTVVSYSLTGLFLHNILLYVFVEWFGISKVVVPLINLCVTIPLNFLLNKYWAFGNKED